MSLPGGAEELKTLAVGGSLTRQIATGFCDHPHKRMRQGFVGVVSRYHSPNQAGAWLLCLSPRSIKSYEEDHTCEHYISCPAWLGSCECEVVIDWDPVEGYGCEGKEQGLEEGKTYQHDVP